MIFDFSDDYSIAYGRSTIMVANGISKDNLSPVFLEGGYYHWTFHKDPAAGQWRISLLKLDINWTEGDSLGLNDPGAAN